MKLALISGCVASEIELSYRSVFSIVGIMFKYGTEKRYVFESASVYLFTLSFC